MPDEVTKAELETLQRRPSYDLVYNGEPVIGSACQLCKLIGTMLLMYVYTLIGIQEDEPTQHVFWKLKGLLKLQGTVAGQRMVKTHETKV